MLLFIFIYFISDLGVQSGRGHFWYVFKLPSCPFIHYKNLPTFIKPSPHSWIFRLFLVLVITNLIMISIFIAKYLHVSIMTFLDYVFRNKIIGDFYHTRLTMSFFQIFTGFSLPSGLKP